jgi:hypothetical protein
LKAGHTVISEASARTEVAPLRADQPAGAQPARDVLDALASLSFVEESERAALFDAMTRRLRAASPEAPAIEEHVDEAGHDAFTSTRSSSRDGVGFVPVLIELGVLVGLLALCGSR